MACRRFTNEEQDFLRMQASSMTISELTKAFNEAYGQNRSWNTIHKKCRTHGIEPRRFLRSDIARGYLKIKTADPRIAGKMIWRRKHVVIWESEHGPVPKGSNIIFADGNNRNFALDNLVEISRCEAGHLVRLNLWSADAEITKSAVKVAKLFVAIRKKIMNGKDESRMCMEHESNA